MRITGNCGLCATSCSTNLRPFLSRRLVPAMSQCRSVITTSKSSVAARAKPLSALASISTLLATFCSSACNAAWRAGGRLSSSSMIKILTMDSGADRGQHNAECCAFPGLSVKDQRPSVAVHDLSGNRQAQTRSALFCAEKRIKQPVLYFGRNAGPVVLHLDHGDSGWLSFQGQFVPVSAQGDIAAVLDA